MGNTRRQRRFFVQSVIGVNRTERRKKREHYRTYRALRFAKASGLCLPLPNPEIATLSLLECWLMPATAGPPLGTKGFLVPALGATGIVALRIGC